MRHPRRPLSVLAGVTVAGLLSTALVACSSEASDEGGASEDRAGSDDPLVVYVGRDEELVAPLLEQFTDETGIEVEARYAGTTEHLATLLEEGDATPADVFVSQDAGALGALSAAGMLRDLPEDVTAAVLPDFTSADGTWVGVTGRARVFAFNPDVLTAADVPDTVAAFTDPEWSGRVGLAPPNASFQAFVTGFRVAEGDDAASTWLTDMVANDVQTFEGNGPLIDAVEAGTVDVALTNHYYLYERIAEVGEGNVPVELVFPAAGDPGALVNVTGAGALSNHPDAEALISYLVSEAGQRYFVENTFEYPLVDGIEAPAGLPALTEIDGPLEDLAQLEDLEATLALIEEAGLS
ncbi:MAG TPA: extracellular solute-binding protein [Nocardioides sp.]